MLLTHYHVALPFTDINVTQSQYTSWIMMIVPIFVIATAPILVEFIGLTSGAVVSILSSFAGARSNLMDLCAMRQEWKLATDLVDDLSILLSSSNSAHGPKERALHTERKAELVMKSSPEALGLCSGLSVHNVDYFTAEKDLRDALSTCSWNGLEGVSGYIPLGCLYGFVQQASDTRQQWRTRPSCGCQAESSCRAT